MTAIKYVSKKNDKFSLILAKNANFIINYNLSKDCFARPRVGQKAVSGWVLSVLSKLQRVWLSGDKQKRPFGWPFENDLENFTLQSVE